MEDIIPLTGLTRRFGTLTAVDRIDLSVHGESVVLMSSVALGVRTKSGEQFVRQDVFEVFAGSLKWYGIEIIS